MALVCLQVTHPVWATSATDLSMLVKCGKQKLHYQLEFTLYTYKGTATGSRSDPLQ